MTACVCIPCIGCLHKDRKSGLHTPICCCTTSKSFGCGRCIALFYCTVRVVLTHLQPLCSTVCVLMSLFWDFLLLLMHRTVCAGTLSTALAASGKPQFPANMEQHPSNLGQNDCGCGHCRCVPWHTCFRHWLALLCPSRLFGWMLPHSSSSAEPCLQHKGKPFCRVFCLMCCPVLLNKYWHET